MICRFCQTWNEDDEHRCVRCGRRLSLSEGRLSENLPIASATAPAYDYAETAPPARNEADDVHQPQIERQPSLFPMRDGRKVIPFESIAPSVPVIPGRGSMPARAQGRRRGAGQRELDFPAPQIRRSLETSVEAAISCDARVARSSARVSSALTDLGFIAVALLLLSTPYVLLRMMGLAGPLPEGPQRYGILGASILLVGLLYHLVWDIANTDTPGMHTHGLRLLNFDGRTPTVRQRLFRLCSSLLSLASGGLGMMWILFDEEGLAWHDHISKTFPAYRQ